MAGPPNAARLRHMYDAFGRRDLDAFLRYCSPGVEIDSDIGSYAPGHEGIRGWWHDLTDAFAFGAPRVNLLVDLGDVLLSFMTGLWRGQTSGVEFEAERTHLTRWHDGLVVWWGFATTVDEAVAAARMNNEQRAALTTVMRIRAAYEALNRRDFAGALEPAHPDVEIVPHMAGLLEGRSWQGREGAREWIEETFDVFDSFALRVQEMRWLGDRCLTRAHLQARGRASGIELDSPWFYLSTIRDGLILRHESFTDEAAALAAAGVSR